MKKKILNTDDNDALNSTADVRNAGAGADYKDSVDAAETTVEAADANEEQLDELKEDKPLPDEIAFPAAQEDSDEMA
jgi:hypothetical protein